MNILLSKHAKIRGIERIDEVINMKQSKKYIKKIFKDTIERYNNWDKWTNRIEQPDWTYRIRNTKHLFAYAQDWDTYIIITYYKKH